MAAMSALGDEAGLARAAAEGDGHAFAALYDAYESRIFNFCHRLVGSPEDAADATQDAFLKVLQRLPKLGDRELNFGAYLFTAARNASYDVIGRRKRADPVDEIPEHGARPVTGDAGGDIYVDPERAALLGSLQESVKSANGRLPERQREVLALRELEELSYDEIAEIMEMNRNGVAQLISRARIKLRDELRGSALASIAASSADCERALPLVAMRQDGQLRDAADRDWLAAHLVGCDTCKVGVDAMEEAGLSYRAWLPIVPLVWLREVTVAKAAELSGSDWSSVAAAGRSGGGRPGSVGAGGGAPGAAGATGLGVGPGSALASEPGSEAAATGSSAAGATRRRRRRVAEAVAGLALLLLLFGALVGALEDDQPPATVSPAAAAETVTPTTGDRTTQTGARKRRTATDAARTTTQEGTTEVTAAAPEPVKTEKAPSRPRTRTDATRTGGGGGNVPAQPPATGTTTTPPPTSTTPAATTTDPPPASTTPPPTTTQPPATTPCDPRSSPTACPPTQSPTQPPTRTPPTRTPPSSGPIP
jgi:RNA polymerase sigma-70 factor (ECF subfamily)